MSVRSDIFDGLAEVFEAGARKCRTWPNDHDMQAEAKVYDAMATKSRELARRDDRLTSAKAS